MKIINFIWYCIMCMLRGIPAIFGDVPKGYTWKEASIGIITFLIIGSIIIGSICLLIRICGKK